MHFLMTAANCVKYQCYKRAVLSRDPTQYQTSRAICIMPHNYSQWEHTELTAAVLVLHENTRKYITLGVLTEVTPQLGKGYFLTIAGLH